MNHATTPSSASWVDRFIERPVLAIVLSLLIVLAGALALGKLPLTEYPNVMPTTVMVRAGYPGANPQVLAQTDAWTLVDGMPEPERAAGAAPIVARVS